jgi:hypothetical protein
MPDRLPSIGLSLRFILTGVMSLIAGTILLVAFPDILATYHYNQRVIAVTHLFVLGFIGSIVMGALYQLVPVALETNLYSARLGRWHFLCHAFGFLGMVGMFWQWNLPAVGYYASLFALGIGLFVYNLVRTLQTVPRWNVIAWTVASVLAWLGLAVLAGLYLAASKCWSFSPFHPIAAMHAHAHLGGIAFLLLIIGISYKLIPMFVLSEIQSQRRAAWSVILLNAGLAGLAITLLFESRWKLLFALVVVGGLAIYGLELGAILNQRKRRRLDWGIRHFLAAVGLLLPLAVLAVVLCWPTLPVTEFTAQLENVYGLTAILGVTTIAILGMLYKIVPFLVWYHCYAPCIGHAPVPSLAEMYRERLQAFSLVFCLTGFLALAAATAAGHPGAVRWAAGIFGVGIAGFTVNLGFILSHLWRSKSILWKHQTSSQPPIKSMPSSDQSSIPSLG